MLYTCSMTHTKKQAAMQRQQHGNQKGPQNFYLLSTPAEYLKVTRRYILSISRNTILLCIHENYKLLLRQDLGNRGRWRLKETEKKPDAERERESDSWNRDAAEKVGEDGGENEVGDTSRRIANKEMQFFLACTEFYKQTHSCLLSSFY